VPEAATGQHHLVTASNYSLAHAEMVALSPGLYYCSSFSEPADIIGIRRTGQLNFDSVQPAAEIQYVGKRVFM